MESNLVIKEYDGRETPCQYTLDLRITAVKDCVGCFSCWLKTPGRCIHKDLDEFYKAYMSSDKVVIFSKVTHGFVSGNLKTLFDRLIPLYLPYITYKTGESMHLPRYEKYPDIEFHYQGEFSSAEDQKIYEDYIHRTFYQFYNKCEIVKPITQFSPEEIYR